MKVFVSWSGIPSHKAAKLLKEWLENVIQGVDVWLSSDIGKGQTWLTELMGALSDINFGISMVTKTNLNAPYLLFEAGALTKTDKGILIPVLCNLRMIDLTNAQSPLARFQGCAVTAEDIWGLVLSVNRAPEQPLAEERRLRNNFEKWWPDFEADFKAIDFSEQEGVPAETTPEKKLGKIEDAIETLLKSSIQQGEFLQQLAFSIANFMRVPPGSGGAGSYIGGGGVAGPGAGGVAGPGYGISGDYSLRHHQTTLKGNDPRYVNVDERALAGTSPVFRATTPTVEEPLSEFKIGKGSNE